MGRLIRTKTSAPPLATDLAALLTRVLARGFSLGATASSKSIFIASAPLSCAFLNKLFHWWPGRTALNARQGV